ncbi:DsbA family protein [Georgenia sp. SUBG003]|uniref:DsbA family protein n=1 Tax=Georgenia sp. SUBG003 TaxID=1497974 RepID=UPI003AB7E6E5
MPANTSVEDGGISLGSEMVAGTENPDAPVLDVYLDFACPHCADFEEVNADDIDSLVTAGEATVVYHPSRSSTAAAASTPASPAAP